MKKIIKILAITVFAAITFFNTNFAGNNNIDLEGLIFMNTANAEIVENREEEEAGECINPETGKVEHTYIDCIVGMSLCTPSHSCNI